MLGRLDIFSGQEHHYLNSSTFLRETLQPARGASADKSAGMHISTFAHQHISTFPQKTPILRDYSCVVVLKIDSHTHILPKRMPNWSEKFGYGDFIYLQHHKKGFAKMMRGNQFFREIGENCWHPELRMKEYDKHNTSVQVVCTIPVMFSYWAKPMDALSLSKYLNDHLAKLVDKYPKNYIGLEQCPCRTLNLLLVSSRDAKK